MVASMSVAPSTVTLIDDDPSVRRALGRVMESAGLPYQVFASAEDCLSGIPVEEIGCVVADMTMMGMNGLEFKRRLNLSRPDIPFIILTAHDTEEMRVSARKAGAAAFFLKPVDIEALLDAIQWTMGASKLEQPA